MWRVFPSLAALVVCCAAPGAAQQTWSIARSPDFVLGSAEGQPETAFHDVRGALQTPQGDLVVADGGSLEIRVFAPSGELITRFGGRGGGPREFESIEWMEYCGGTAVSVYDRRRRRLTRWTPQGDLVEEINVEGLNGLPPFTAYCGHSGSLAVIGWPDIGSYSGGIGPYRMDVDVGAVDSGGGATRSVGRFPGPERYRYGGSDGPRPLGRNTVVRPFENGVYVVTGDAYQVIVARKSGGQRSFGRELDRRRMTPELVRTWHDSVVARFPPAERASARQGLREHQGPDKLPAYSFLMFDELGRLWARHHGAPGERTDTWDIYTDERWIASVTVPNSFRPTQISKDWILGVKRDGMGIERIERRELIGP